MFERSSGGSRILKRGVPVCDLSARRAPARGVWRDAPPGKFWISGFLRSFLVYSWGEIAKAGRHTAKPVVCRIKGVTPLRVAEAAKQQVIRVKRG